MGMIGLDSAPEIKIDAAHKDTIQGNAEISWILKALIVTAIWDYGNLEVDGQEIMLFSPDLSPIELRKLQILKCVVNSLV